MGRIVVVNNMTLDGVMQAPGRPDEDTRGGFEHGGWAVERNADPVVGQAMAEGMAAGGPLLLGRRTYEAFADFWPKQRDNPFTDVLNRTQKYVASRTLSDPLPWQNSTLLSGDAADGAAELKRESDRDIGVLGSGELLESLIRHDLVDRYVLLIHPIVLGTGRQLFPEGAPPTAFDLVDTAVAGSGVIVATYQRNQEDR